MANETFLARIIGLTLKGFHEYKKIWEPTEGEKLKLEVEKEPIRGSLPVGALTSDGETVGHAGIEYCHHLRKLIYLRCSCKAVVKDTESKRFKPIPYGGEEIMCDYVVKGPYNKTTRLALSLFLTKLRSDILNLYQPSMKVKINGKWLFGEKLQQELADKTPEELEDDPETMKLYEKALNSGKAIDKSVRVMIIGCYGQGKTTLVRRLMGEEVDTVTSTDGIDIHRCRCEQNSSRVVWIKEDNCEKENSDKQLARIMKNLINYQKSSANGRHTIKEDLQSGLQESVTKRRSTPTAIPGPSNETRMIFGNVTSGKRKHQSQRQGSDVPGDEDRSAPYYSPSSKKPKLDDLAVYQSVRNQLPKVDSIEDDEVTMHLWDFSGQFIYYATHQLFHERTAVYLLVFDLSKSLEENILDEDFPGQANSRTMKYYIQFWMNSIHSFVGRQDGKEPVVILVGTHLDKLQDEEQAELYFEQIRDLFRSCNTRYHIHKTHFKLSLLKGWKKGVDKLRKTIQEMGEKPETQKLIPARWVYLKRSLYELQAEKIITFDELVQIDRTSSHPIAEEGQLKLFLKYMHERGLYVYFDDSRMKNFVVLQPQFVIQAFSRLIRSRRFFKADPDLAPLWHKLTDEAVLQPELINAAWNKRPAEFITHKERLISLLKKTRIISEVSRVENEILQPQGFYIVPSLLRHPDDGNVKAFLRDKSRTTCSFIFEFTCDGVVETVFQRILAAAITKWPVLYFKDTQMMFSNAGIFEFNQDHAGLIEYRRNIIELLVVSLDLERGVVQGQGDLLRRFVEVVIRHEFSKLRNGTLNNAADELFCRKGRCFHSSHSTKGSSRLFTVNVSEKKLRKKMACPDRQNHFITYRDIRRDWLDTEISPENFPKSTLSLKELHRLAQAIGKDWELLGVGLGLSNVEIQHIKDKKQDPVLRNYYMLERWSNRKAENATFDVLVEELIEMNKENVDWDIVNNVNNRFYQPSF